MSGFSKKEKIGRNVAEQLANQIESMEKRTKRPQKYMAYLQSGANTYGDLGYLAGIFSQVVTHPKVVSVSIGTRSDCIDEVKLDLIESIFAGYDVWIELGVQSAHDITLNKVNRNHMFSDTARAINLIKKRGFFVCAHLILGLPGENERMMHQSVQAMNEFGVHGVKFHPLSITKGAALETDWKNDDIRLFDRHEYTDLVIELMEHLSPEITIQRLIGGGRPEVHLAPEWALRPAGSFQLISAKMKRRNTWQGKKYSR
jgi:hypothetical protein